MKGSISRPGPKKSCLQAGRWMELLLFLALIYPRFAIARIGFGESLRELEVQQEQGPIAGSSRIEAWNCPAAFSLTPTPAHGVSYWRWWDQIDSNRRKIYSNRKIEHMGIPYLGGDSLSRRGVRYSGKIIIKIFQPLCAMRPTGEGTGLGLSLSYDIIVKGHGGKLNVETIPGEMSAFVIILPPQSEA